LVAAQSYPADIPTITLCILQRKNVNAQDGSNLITNNVTIDKNKSKTDVFYLIYWVCGYAAKSLHYMCQPRKKVIPVRISVTEATKWQRDTGEDRRH